MSNLRKKVKFSHGGDEEGGGEKKSNMNVVSSSSLKPETSENSEHYKILSNFKVLTGEKHRDKWLERLLQAIQFICNLHDHSETTDTEKKHTSFLQKEEIGMFPWPDAVVPAVVALEKIAHDTLSSDFHKYNQKMRQLFFNLKKYTFLAQRFLMGELEPSQLLNMSPNELKEGVTAEKYAKEQTEEPNRFQMTEASCGRCMEKRVGVIDIIQSGRGQRYQA
ncbi:uncharacterized protein LOC124928825 [Impatiens glandulifera]|uniref:uncharacterized protein LOC124928825 n=1 Tax=Impatiens glandulifera TaxID=253017 RepID=UPI001FB18FC5|nr:uncharacterized protein LOC124928825 [Impatiens glandulifera]